MSRKQNLKILVLLCSSVMLVGCNTWDTFKHSKDSNTVITSTYELVIQTVEFTSHTAVTNVGVTLFDFNTGERIASDLVDQNGKIRFTEVKQNEPYEIVIYRVLPNGEWMEQSRQQIVYDYKNPSLFVETFHANSQDPLAVPFVNQNPELPNGCEITALTALLNYFGLSVDKMQLALNYLPKESVVRIGTTRYGPDPNIAYAGDPREAKGGYYVFAQPIVEVANQVLFEHGSEYRALDLSKSTKEEIINYVQSGVPVLTWVTIDYKKPRTYGHWLIEGTNRKHPVFMNLHAVVVTGYHNGKVTVMNPLTGYETVNEDTFFETYKGLGSHAMIIL